MSHYLKFKLIEEKPKTDVYEVCSKMTGLRLGMIKWFGRWRQYSFFPENETVFNGVCLDDIISFIKGLR